MLYIVSWRPLLNPLCFFFNDTATTEIYTLSLHDALPISTIANAPLPRDGHTAVWTGSEMIIWGGLFYDGTFHYLDRKSTRLNSSHQIISYAVFCLKKKKPNGTETRAARSAPRKQRTHHVS